MFKVKFFSKDAGMMLDVTHIDIMNNKFTAKYGEQVKVFTIGDFSIEVCGGPHVTNTRELGHFRIIKEEASSAGVRRIRAVLEPGNFESKN